MMIRNALAVLLMAGVAMAQSGNVSGGASAQSNSEVKAGAGQAQVNAKSEAKVDAKAQADAKAAKQIHAELVKGVKAGKNKAGDVVVAKTTKATTTAEGTVIPKGSQLIGRITEAQARAKGQSESRLGLIFEKAKLRDGREIPLNAMVQAVGAARSAAQVSGDDTLIGGTAAGSGAVSGGGQSGGGGGLLGGVGSTVGAVTNTAGNVVGGVGSTVNSTVGGTLSSTTNITSELTSNSRGVLGLEGVSLNGNGAASNVTTLSSTTKNVELNSGTQLLLSLTGNTSAAKQ